jgi:hypothetical protein
MSVSSIHDQINNKRVKKESRNKTCSCREEKRGEYYEELSVKRRVV